MKKKIVNICLNYYTRTPISDYYIIKDIMKKIKHCDKRAFVFGAPFHENMGDQAQSYCTECWIKSNYPDYSPIIIETRFLQSDNNRLLHMIKENINNDDLIFLHSGYHTTDLYMREENLQRDVIQLFSDRQIVILPQTINYINEKEQQKSSEIYNQHPNLLMFARDEVSFSLGKTIFYNAHILLYPDIVTTQIGTQKFNNERNGILLCLRNDKEAKYSKSEINNLKEQLTRIGKVDETDTSIDLNPLIIRKNREKYLNKIWNRFSKYKLVITDRYHGTIFSLIANTPVLVISSTDHKLESGVRWFPKEYNDYVEYVEDLSLVPKKVKEKYYKMYNYSLPQYFNKKYYDKLKEVIEKNVEN